MQCAPKFVPKRKKKIVTERLFSLLAQGFVIEKYEHYFKYVDIPAAAAATYVHPRYQGESHTERLKVRAQCEKKKTVRLTQRDFIETRKEFCAQLPRPCFEGLLPLPLPLRNNTKRRLFCPTCS